MGNQKNPTPTPLILNGPDTVNYGIGIECVTAPEILITVQTGINPSAYLCLEPAGSGRSISRSYSREVKASFKARGATITDNTPVPSAAGEGRTPRGKAERMWRLFTKRRQGGNSSPGNRDWGGVFTAEN